jgi:hypothetical protein
MKALSASERYDDAKKQKEFDDIINILRGSPGPIDSGDEVGQKRVLLLQNLVSTLAQGSS